MPIPSSIQSFDFANTTVRAFVPTIEWLQVQLETAVEKTTPYWAQVWPAAKALCEVIAAEQHLVKNKIVLELAAGLGLPSLLAAQSAKQVIATDYILEAVEMMKISAESNNLTNMQCRVMDWNKLDKKLHTDILLLSDINYNPRDFEQLYKVLTRFIDAGTTVLLSTPQRLMAKPFMEKLLPWQAKAYTIDVAHNGETVFTTVWILKKH